MISNCRDSRERRGILPHSGPPRLTQHGVALWCPRSAGDRSEQRVILLRLAKNSELAVLGRRVPVGPLARSPPGDRLGLPPLAQVTRVAESTAAASARVLEGNVAPVLSAEISLDGD